MRIKVAVYGRQIDRNKYVNFAGERLAHDMDADLDINNRNFKKEYNGVNKRTISALVILILKPKIASFQYFIQAGKCPVVLLAQAKGFFNRLTIAE